MVFSSVIFGVACIALPLIVWAVMDEDWTLEIPFLDITYKPYGKNGNLFHNISK